MEFGFIICSVVSSADMQVSVSLLGQIVQYKPYNWNLFLIGGHCYLLTYLVQRIAGIQKLLHEKKRINQVRY